MSYTDGDHTLTHDQFAGQLSSKYLHCRELGHTWRPWGVSWDGRSRAYTRTIRCSSCHTERHMVVDSTGGVVSSHYTYAGGYQAKHVEKGLRRDVFRLEAIERELNMRERRIR